MGAGFYYAGRQPVGAATPADDVLTDDERQVIGRVVRAERLPAAERG